MIQVTVDLSRFLARMNKVHFVLESAPLLKAIGFRLRGFVDESFRTEGRGKWVPMAASTRRIRGSGAKLLQDSGDYRKSFEVASDNRTYVEIGSSMTKRAEWMERGTHPHTIVARNAPQLVAMAADGTYIPFGKKVRHPGTPPRSVLPTEKEALQLATEVIEAKLKDV